MRDPSTALLLFVLVIVAAFLLSPRWAAARAVLTGAVAAAAYTTSVGQAVSGSQPSGVHTPSGTTTAQGTVPNP